jgi:hypothetical protein
MSRPRANSAISRSQPVEILHRPAEDGRDQRRGVWDGRSAGLLTNELHVAHCAFDGLKFYRAVANRCMVHKEFRFSYTEHCSHVLRSQSRPLDIENLAVLRFPDCGFISETLLGWLVIRDRE